MGGSMFYCVIGIAVISVVLLFVLRNSRLAHERALVTTKQAYHDALAKLRANPTSADLRAAALTAGRAYLSVDSGVMTSLNEASLKNDLDAAAAGAIVFTTTAPAAADRLRQLDQLKADGLITDAEYAARREKILGEV